MNAPELDLLLEELREVVGRLPPRSAAIELGRFVETVHEALRNTLSFDENAHIDSWHLHLNKAGLDVHASFYQPLHSIYGCRNLVGHNNADAHSITANRVQRDFETIAELVPSLVERVSSLGKDLLGALWRVQTVVLRSLRASRLEAVIATIPSWEGLPLDCVAAEAAPLLPNAVLAGLARATPAARLRRYIATLGKAAKEDITCPLLGLASRLSSQIHHPSLQEWLSWDTQVRAARALDSRRLNVFRVVVYPAGDGWQVWDAQVIQPAHPDLNRVLGNFPVEAPTRDMVGSTIIDLFNLASQKAKQLALPADAREYVLHLALPVEIAAESWEMLRAGAHRPLLSTQFLCITIEPIDQDRLSAEMHEPIHPRFDVAEIWAPFDVDHIAAVTEGRAVLLLGPTAWHHELGNRPALFWVMDQHPAALVTDHATSDEALQALFPGDHPQPWVEILRRVKQLRLARQNLKVFWTDRRYSPVQATSL